MATDSKAFNKFKETRNAEYISRKLKSAVNLSKNSPKYKFFAQIHTDKPIGTEGQLFGARGMTVEDTKHNCYFYIEQAKKFNANTEITILENKKQYPEFDWVEVERYCA
jgi:hypothetical protein